MMSRDSEWEIARKLANRNDQDLFRILVKGSDTGLTHTYLFYKETKEQPGKLIAITPFSYLGAGAFGKVKEGKSEDGVDVVIKRQDAPFSANEQQALEALGYFFASGSYTKMKKVADNSPPVEVQKYILVQKRIVGIPLDRYLKISSLTVEQRNKIAYLVIKAINRLQNVKRDLVVIHGDIKPDNLILGMNEVTPVDFGASVICTSAEDKYQAQFTQGAQKYKAPETDRKNILSVASDNYAVGMLLKKDVKIQHELVERLLAANPDDRPKLSDLLSHFSQWESVELPVPSQAQLAEALFNNVMEGVKNYILEKISSNLLFNVILPSRKSDSLVIVYNEYGHIVLVKKSEIKNTTYKEALLSDYIASNFSQKSVVELLKDWEAYEGKGEDRTFTQDFEKLQEGLVAAVKTTFKLINNVDLLSRFFEQLSKQETTLPILKKKPGSIFGALFSLFSSNRENIHWLQVADAYHAYAGKLSTRSYGTSSS